MSLPKTEVISVSPRARGTNLSRQSVAPHVRQSQARLEIQKIRPNPYIRYALHAPIMGCWQNSEREHIEKDKLAGLTVSH